MIVIPHSRKPMLFTWHVSCIHVNIDTCMSPLVAYNHRLIAVNLSQELSSDRDQFSAEQGGVTMWYLVWWCSVTLRPLQIDNPSGDVIWSGIFTHVLGSTNDFLGKDLHDLAAQLTQAERNNIVRFCLLTCCCVRLCTVMVYAETPPRPCAYTHVWTKAADLVLSVPRMFDSCPSLTHTVTLRDGDPGSFILGFYYNFTNYNFKTLEFHTSGKILLF